MTTDLSRATTRIFDGDNTPVGAGGLWSYEKQWRKVKAIAEPVQAVLAVDREVWVGTPLALKKLSGKGRRKWQDIAGASQAAINALVVGPNGAIWAGTDLGLMRIATGQYDLFTTDNSGLSNNFVQCLAFDGNLLWVGTANGLSRFTTTL